MIRIVEFPIQGGEPVRLASMLWAQAETHVTETAEMLKKVDDVPAGDWLKRTGGVVVDAINRAKKFEANISHYDAQPIDLEYLKNNFDIPTIREMADKVLEMSGLLPKNVGEVKAP